MRNCVAAERSINCSREKIIKFNFIVSYFRLVHCGKSTTLTLEQWKNWEKFWSGNGPTTQRQQTNFSQDLFFCCSSWLSMISHDENKQRKETKQSTKSKKKLKAPQNSRRKKLNFVKQKFCEWIFSHVSHSLLLSIELMFTFPSPITSLFVLNHSSSISIDRAKNKLQIRIV